MSKHTSNFNTTFFIKVLNLFIILAANQIPGFCQESLTREDFLAANKKHRKTAWILTGVGLGIYASGMSVAISSINHDPISSALGINGRLYAGGLLGVAGIVVIVTGVRHFIMAGKNKRKATLMLSTNDVPRVINQNVCYRKLPSVRLRIQL